MKIATLLTAAIVSLSAVGGGLAAYVAVTKYQTMDQVSVAQSRLEIVRAVGDLPRYINPERGFSTNILFGPPSRRSEAACRTQRQISQADRRRAQQDEPGQEHPARRARRRRRRGKRHRCAECEIRGACASPSTRPSRVRSTPAATPAKKIVADNTAFNAAVTALLDEQVRKMAALDGDAYRQASYANIAWTLRDIGGLNASLHKNLVGAKRAATDAEKMELSRVQGRTDQILSSLQELRGNPATPANVAAALDRMNEAYVERFGKELKMVKDGAISGNTSTTPTPSSWNRSVASASVIEVRDAFYDNAEQILGAAYSVGAPQLHDRARGPRRGRGRERRLVVMVRRRVCRPIVDLTASMSRLAGGDVAERNPGRRAQRRDRRDGGRRRGLQGQQDRGGSAGRREGSRERRQDAARARARRPHARLRSEGERVGRRIVVGLGQDGRYRPVDVLDRGATPTARPRSSPPPRNRPRPTCRRSPAPPKN